MNDRTKLPEDVKQLFMNLYAPIDTIGKLIISDDPVLISAMARMIVAIESIRAYLLHQQEEITLQERAMRKVIGRIVCSICPIASFDEEDSAHFCSKGHFYRSIGCNKDILAWAEKGK